MRSDYTTDLYTAALNIRDTEVLQIESLTDFRGGEYAPYIADYSRYKIAVTNRLIEPYSAKKTHGQDTYKGYKDLIERLKPKSVLDLGCGNGELLEEIRSISPETELFGCTIHIGEVIEAKKKGIEVVAFDMRIIDSLFKEQSIDLVIAHASLHFLTPKDQVTVGYKVHKILHPHGRFFVVHYKTPDHHTIIDFDNLFIPVAIREGFFGPAYEYKPVFRE